MVATLASNPRLVAALGHAIEAHDLPTYVHSCRVASRAVSLAAVARVGDRETAALGWAGLLHDLGKVAVRPEVLGKPGPLTPSEWAEIQRHPAVGADIVLSVSDRLAPVAAAIRSHHEWYDGSGYPDGLLGDGIPLLGRLLAISDVYDSLTAERPYRQRRYTHHQALELMESESGTHFDPELLQAFLDQTALP